MVEKKKENKKKYFYARGTDKKASANVRLYKGKGESLINNKKYPDEFKNKVEKGEFKPLVPEVEEVISL